MSYSPLPAAVPLTLTGLSVGGAAVAAPVAATAPGVQSGSVPAGATIACYFAGLDADAIRALNGLAGATAVCRLGLPGGWSPPFFARVAFASLVRSWPLGLAAPLGLIVPAIYAPGQSASRNQLLTLTSPAAVPLIAPQFPAQVY